MSKSDAGSKAVKKASKATKNKSTAVANPNEGGSGFIWALVALLVIAAAVIGYIVMDNRNNSTEAMAENADDVAMTVDFKDNVATVAGEDASKDAPVVDLYEDYSCPHCAELAEATDGDMKKAIEDGDMKVNIHMLNFLDLGRGELENYISDDKASTDGHSTTAATAAAILAKNGDADAYWNLRTTLFDDQQDLYNKADFKKLSEMAKAFGASDESVDQIKNADHGLGNEIGKQSAKKLNDETGSVSSPRVFVGGKEVEGADLNKWVSIATEKA